jgi:hypothetical protein
MVALSRAGPSRHSRLDGGPDAAVLVDLARPGRLRRAAGGHARGGVPVPRRQAWSMPAPRRVSVWAICRRRIGGTRPGRGVRQFSRDRRRLVRTSAAAVASSTSDAPAGALRGRSTATGAGWSCSTPPGAAQPVWPSRRRSRSGAKPMTARLPGATPPGGRWRAICRPTDPSGAAERAATDPCPHRGHCRGRVRHPICGSR